VLFPDATWAWDLSDTRPVNTAARSLGQDWPTEALTMVGLRRLDNLQFCIEQALRDDVTGDLVETGVWRGGCGILMRAALKAFGDQHRSVWLADSFQGVPAPSPEEYPQDAGDTHWQFQDYLGVSADVVKANFEQFELLDDRVRFLPGWFRDTLPTAPIDRISVLRLDGDMYESTYVALTSLYPKVSRGGFVIVDDYGAIPRCRQAVDDFRTERHITDALLPVDWTGVYWRRAAAP
jgi:O-methyltransferase